MIGLLVQNWWALALRGVVAVIFGILALALPGITAESLILLFGIFALADGVFAIAAGIWAVGHHHRWRALVVEGLISLVAGMIAVIVPLAAALGFVLLMALWAIATGIFEFAAAVRLREEIQGELLLALSGILSIAFGVVIGIFPGAGLLALIWLIGAYALISGIALIALAFRLRRHAVP